MREDEGTIFIVDDDEAVRDSLGLLMRSLGYRARCYPSGEAFLEAWDPKAFGCLVLDIRMPGMDGMALQKALDERGSELPIIFITGHGDIPMAVEVMRAEARERLDILECMERLTAREREVMDQVVTGKANKVIAADLGVSQRTVEIHRARVMEKMGAGSLAQLVRMVMLAEPETAEPSN